jgi:hypothetical protein
LSLGYIKEHWRGGEVEGKFPNSGLGKTLCKPNGENGNGYGMESAFIILKMHCVGGLVYLSMVFAAD